MSEKAQKQMSHKRLKSPAKQGKTGVGKGGIVPPKPHQFKPGQSGNPKGPPKHHVQLWTYICRYMAMTDSQLNKLQGRKLSQSQQWALRIVKSTKKLSFPTLDRFVRYVIDQDEGRPAEHMFVQKAQNVLTDEQCEEIPQMLRANFEASKRRSDVAK